MTDHGEHSEQRERGERYKERGGEAACWAHLVCPDCGAMESEGHRPECPASRPRSPADEPSAPSPDHQA
ncbi:MAG: hypothetical protein ACRDRJ_07145 [Streptosporangiaceae bacterium]